MMLGPNPYYNRTSVKEECDFFGRRRELTKIHNLIQAGVPQSISIVGDRRIGKSSLLRAILHRRNKLQRPDEFVFVALDLQENVHGDISQFFSALLEEIGTALHDSDLAQQEPTYENVHKVVAGLSRKHLKLVILVDEFDAVTRNQNFTLEFFSFLRSLPNNYSVSFIVTSARQLPDICHSREIAGSPFFNIFHKLNLAPFPPEEAMELIAAPSQAVGYSLEAYSALILSLAGHFPFFLQMACSACIEFHQEYPERDTLDERSIRHTFSEEVRDHFEYIWNHFSDRDRAVCFRICGREKLTDAYNSFLQSLNRRGYVYLEPEIRLFSSVFDEFIQVKKAGPEGPTDLRQDIPAAVGETIEWSSDETTGRSHPQTNQEGMAGDLQGQLIGRFRVCARLGAGGMGEVYLADDMTLNRPVALKRMAAALRDKPEYCRRFIREAQRVSQLSNPHIAGIYDVLEERGEVFLVMEYVKGQTLRTVLNTRLRMKESLEIAWQCAEALTIAHAKGIVHRDIKPENIMVTAEGQAKILDFGLAIALPQGGDNTSNPTVTLTNAGTFAGTPAYAAPEMIRGDRLDGRSDIFSLGVVLYEALSGSNPFRAATVFDTAQRILHDKPPSLLKFDPNVPHVLDGIVRKCLEKNPDRRYQQSRDLAADLASVRRGPALKTSTESGPGVLSRIVAWLR